MLFILALYAWIKLYMQNAIMNATKYSFFFNNVLIIIKNKILVTLV